MRKVIKKIRSLPNKLLNKKGFRIISSPKFSLHSYEKLYGKDAVTNRRFVNIGAGVFRHPAWTNVDHYSSWYRENPIDVDWDLTSDKPLPVSDNSTFIVYSSHTIEHITNRNAEKMFKESYRILKKKGIIRISTPDFELAYWAYMSKDKRFFKNPGKLYENRSIEQLFLYSFASQLSTMYDSKKGLSDENIKKLFNSKKGIEAADLLISKCRISIQNENPGHHINWWTADKLIRMIKKAGFKEVYKSGYGQSRSPALRNTRYFDISNPRLSLYVEGIK